MNQRSSDLFNDPTNNQLAQDIQDKALASEREAQERALMEKHNVIKEITYISKCGQFTANNLDDLITKMNQANQYTELVARLPKYLKITGKDADYRDILEYIANHYKLEPRNNDQT